MDNTDWEIAEEKNSRKGYLDYLARYPAGLHAEEARKQLVNPNKPDFMVLIPGGTFRLGCTSEQQDCGSDESPVHMVNISDFYISKYEVTVADFRFFVNETAYKTDAERGDGSYVWQNSEWVKKIGINWRNDPEGKVAQDNQPVIHVSFNDAIAYCEWLSEKSEKIYRLPTEAEWEYAARAGGKQVLFGNGKNIADPYEMNFDASENNKKSYSVVGTYRRTTVPVGSLNTPNSLGLHDMSGNVWEWCSDWYGNYSSGSQTNPRGPNTGDYRVFRGGGWNGYAKGCRVSDRGYGVPDYRASNLGFRLASSVSR
jgi:formylglycine-generating enzyme required for sulfatase activity